jgi:hypothetical protein
VKLLIPFVDKLREADTRLIRMAEFLGIDCQPLPLAKPAGQISACFEQPASEIPCCLVVNPGVCQEWLQDDRRVPELAAFIASQFQHVLVHAVRANQFDGDLICSLSDGGLRGIQKISESAGWYAISQDARAICDAFAGLTFGPANPGNDHIFEKDSSASKIQTLVSIGSGIFMAAIKREKAEVLFVGSADVADLDAETGDAPVAEYFSRLLPQAMALRHIFGEQSWRPSEQHASVVVDDPLLRPNYGFLNFEKLLTLTKAHNFQTTLAFIPHNYRRSSPRVTRMFRENPDRLSLCFHGNDHTGAEFAASDVAMLDTMLHIADQRMSAHRKLTGLECDRVMVFPQGNFSIEAMAVLKAHNFDAAVNTTPHPRQQPVNLTWRERMQPAVLRYAGFPLFLRNNSARTQSPDIAFNLFFGRPALIVEHHDVFQNPDTLIEAVARINTIAPEIKWSSLGSAVSNSILRRRDAEGIVYIRAFSRTARVTNSSNSAQSCRIEWPQPAGQRAAQQVLCDGAACHDFEQNDSGIRLAFDLDPGCTKTFSVVYPEAPAGSSRLGLRWKARAFVRRRLSEVRDNYISKNPPVLALAQSLQRLLGNTNY